MLLKALKESFEEYYGNIFPDFDLIKEQFFKHKRKSIRINTLKVSVEEIKMSLIKKGISLEKIPFIDNGFFVDSTVTLGNLLEHSLGFIYVQDASSMIPALVLNPQPGEIVLDAASAPGSKTTHMAELMRNQGVIIANDVDGSRLSILSANIQRLGIKNVVVVRHDATVFDFGMQFDKILIDAPCSATGTISLDEPAPAIMWNPHVWRRLSTLQLKLLNNLWRFLRKEGFLVYSTCSLDPMENEYVISEFLKMHEDAEVVPIYIPNLKVASGIRLLDKTSFNEEVVKCIRIMPYFYGSEGFFICKLKKKG
ncbi:MAG: RsmB/NOP family class I SAM-dependent RNA methyltransferase [Candidatus Woesearchaeota archaeon]